MITESTIKPKTEASAYRIFVADPNKSRYEPFFADLEKLGIDVLHTNDREKVVELAEKFFPDLIIINLFLGAATTLSLISELKAKFPSVHFILVTRQLAPANIKEFVKVGISDCLLDPFEPSVLLERVRYQLQDRQLILPEKLGSDGVQHLEECLTLLYQAMRVVAELKGIQNCLHECLKLVQSGTSSSRVNIMTGDFETGRAFVLATSDDPNFTNKELSLEKYPEVREVLLQGNVLYLNDINGNPLTKDIKNQVKSIKIESLMVFPIRHKGETIATMNVKIPTASAFNSNQIKTFYMIALSIGPKVAGSILMTKMRPAAPTTT